MKCIYCGSETKVVDKRESDIDENRRRRECLKCKKRFTTYERIEHDPLIVIKKDGRRQQFDRLKLKTGMLKACEKRPVSEKDIDKMVFDIEAELRASGKNEIPSKLIGELVMKELKNKDTVAYIRFASVYKSFKDIGSFEREINKLKVIDKDNAKTESSTDLSLLVTTSSKEEAFGWDKDRIVKTLTKETGIAKEEAEDIADSVEKKVFSSGLRTITVSLIRELIDNELFVRGFNKGLEKQNLLGMSNYNLQQIIFSKSNENSNIVYNNPEAVNLAIAENTLKQYALKEVFSPEISEAHLKGAIHLHNLGYLIRVYCSAHSLEFIKKYGLKLTNLTTTSKPAKYAMTLTGHLNTFLASMQAYYAGALAINYVNIFYAPYLVGMSESEMKQQAQYLIFSCSQNAFSRGGQTLFIDFNIHLGVPKYLADVPAIGPKGEYTGKTYKDYEKEAQTFAKIMLEVWKDGDANGTPFPFPKCNLHVNEDSFKDPEQLKLLKYACEVASVNGSPYFVFDRDEVNLSMCCRLRTNITDNYVIQHPESMRFCGFQNVSINLPQCAYRAEGDLKKTLKEVEKMVGLTVKAHQQKKKFIEKLMKPGCPLWQVGMTAPDGRPYLDLDKATYIIGMVGLNECVKRLTGKELHESDEAYKTGIRVISAMYLKAKEYEKETGMTLKLEETPAESVSLRFAKLDLQHYPESTKYVRGNQKTGDIYYTNSIHFAPDAPISIFERIEKQGRFNPLIESGAITHVFVGEYRPDPESIFNLVKKTWYNTQSVQITISPEFTVCEDCGKVSPGFMRQNVVEVEEE